MTHRLSADAYERCFRLYATPAAVAHLDAGQAARRARVTVDEWKHFVAERKALADAEQEANRLRRLPRSRLGVMRCPSRINDTHTINLAA